ncbi:hypothetical protein FRX31_004543, partial [Thalictrum thalictroides]
MVPWDLCPPKAKQPEHTSKPPTHAVKGPRGPTWQDCLLTCCHCGGIGHMKKFCLRLNPMLAERKQASKVYYLFPTEEAVEPQDEAI